MANHPEEKPEEAKAAPRKFTLITGESKESESFGSLKIGGNPQSKRSVPKPLTTPETTTPFTPEAKVPHPGIQFDEAPTSVHSQPDNGLAKSPGVSKGLLAVEGIAAVVAIIFTVLIFQDLLPYL